ncbi:hypothetical protein ACLOJK_035532 [Asimina triloba]
MEVIGNSKKTWRGREALCLDVGAESDGDLVEIAAEDGGTPDGRRTITDGDPATGKDKVGSQEVWEPSKNGGDRGIRKETE